MRIVHRVEGEWSRWRNVLVVNCPRGESTRGESPRGQNSLVGTINWYLSIVNMTCENIILLIEWFQFGTVYLIMW